MADELIYPKDTNVAVWGTFDILHSGHKCFLKEASKYGNLSVIMIPDKLVFENKGYLPHLDKNDRYLKLKSLPYVKNVYEDCLSKGLKSIWKIKPTIFVFGYDQKTVWESRLEDFFAKNHLNPNIVRLSMYANGLHCKDIRKQKTFIV